jgi:hypothetical protein
MAQHGVDGAFLQRFATEVEGGDQGIKRIRDEVVDRVRDAAEKEGRVFAIMQVVAYTLDDDRCTNTTFRYDVTGVPAERIQQVLQRDWIHLWRIKRILDSPAYLREKGKPVVALWGASPFHYTSPNSYIIHKVSVFLIVLTLLTSYAASLTFSATPLHRLLMFSVVLRPIGELGLVMLTRTQGSWMRGWKGLMPLAHGLLEDIR